MKRNSNLLLWSLGLLALVPTGVFAAAYSATGAGTSTIGPNVGDDYATLKAAVDAINAAGSRDASTWEFQITGNTTEPANCSLAIPVNANGKIIFKPAAGVSPTITFTNNLDNNLGASGNFLIGGTATTDWPTASLGVRNIEIDGNNGTIDRALTFTNSGITVANQALVVLVADADNITIKNTRFVNTSTSTGANSAGIAVRPRLSGANNLTPDNFLIENNFIQSITGNQGVGINITNSLTLTAGSASNGFTIRNNDIEARIRGLFVNYGYGFTFENNRVTVTGISGTDSFGINNNTANTPPAYTTVIRNNSFFINNPTSGANTQGTTGLFLGTMGAGYDRVVQVYNNQIVLINTGARNASIAANIRGITASSGISWRIYNNSIYIPDNTGTANSISSHQNAYGIGGWAAATYNAEVVNNVVYTSEANVAALSVNTLPSGNGSGLLSNFNNWFSTGGAFTARTGTTTVTTYSTLANWQAVAGNYDLASISVDPTSLWTNIAGPSYNLRLNADPTGTTWVGVPISTVTTDIDGTTRSTTRPYKGFDERAAALSGTATAPSSASISNSSVAENSAADTVVGNLMATDPDSGDALGWFIVSGGNSAFKVNGGQLRVANSTLINFESTPTINLTVRGYDLGGDFVDLPVTVSLTNVNEAPTDITTSPSSVSVAENTASGTAIATLSTTDVDAGDTFVYTLVAGTGSTNNALFTIVGNELRVNAALDFETLGGSLSVRVQTQDQGGTGLTYQEAIAITLTDVAGAPAVSLSSLDFGGGVIVGNTSDLTVDVTSSNGEPFNITALGFTTGSNFSLVGAPTLPAAAPQTLTVRFAPTAAVVYNDTLNVTTSGSSNPTVSLTGQGNSAVDNWSLIED